jgi:hypothetical protein
VACIGSPVVVVRPGQYGLIGPNSEPTRVLA